MFAMQLMRPGQPLQPSMRADPAPGPGQVLIKVACCGVCRTDLHIVDGELPALDHPVVPGHEIVGRVIAQVARHQGRDIFAFTRPGDAQAQKFALELGAVWAGGSDLPAPRSLDAALIFAPVGALVPAALKTLVPGGTVVCAGIHMSDIPSFPYSILWQERKIVSVANLTRKDGEEFMALAAQIPIQTHIKMWPLSSANEA